MARMLESDALQTELNAGVRAAIGDYVRAVEMPPAGAPGGILQQMTLTNSSQGSKRLMIRLKITFTVAGRSVVKMTQVDNIPAEL